MLYLLWSGVLTDVASDLEGPGGDGGEDPDLDPRDVPPRGRPRQVPPQVPPLTKREYLLNL